MKHPWHGSYLAPSSLIPHCLSLSLCTHDKRSVIIGITPYVPAHRVSVLWPSTLEVTVLVLPGPLHIAVHMLREARTQVPCFHLKEYAIGVLVSHLSKQIAQSPSSTCMGLFLEFMFWRIDHDLEQVWGGLVKGKMLTLLLRKGGGQWSQGWVKKKVVCGLKAGSLPSITHF